MSFVHLHNHSHYSILEWLPKPSQYVKKALEYNMWAVALTDTANIHGCHELYTSAKDAWIKPILWAEVFVDSSLDKNLSHKLVLLAKNKDGYKNLLELISASYIDSSKNYQASISFETIKKFSGSIACLSGPISSEISYALLTGKTDEEIYEMIRFYQSIFGKENYFLELLFHSDIPKQELVTNRLIEIYKKYSIPVLAANNCYYIEKEDKTTQDIIMCLGTGHEMENPDRPTLINGDYSFLSWEEMEELFWYIPESLENTKKLADAINIEIETGCILMPTFKLEWENKSLYERFLKETEKNNDLQTITSDEFYLRYICFSGMEYRYGISFPQKEIFEYIKKRAVEGLEKKLQDTEPDELRLIPQKFFTEEKKLLLKQHDNRVLEIIDRLEYELFVVHEMGFDAYFLIVSDYISWAKKSGIPVWPWRWSAAGSLLAYLSAITDLDPLAYDLLFERFLNPARVSMPDIDTDFSDDARDRVVDYCRQKYGQDRVAQICTFGTFAARAAVKDVGRVMGISFAEMNELAKLIPEKPWTKLAWALSDSPEFKNAYETDERSKKIIDEAMKIEGNVRQLWVHACAVIIAPERLTNFTALQHPPKDNESIVTQYSAYPLEDLGLLKMDFLGLRNLTIIKRALKIIKEVKWEEFDILKIPLDDKKVFEVFSNGDTTGVFQFESAGMRTWLKNLKPTDINDIIAMVSLYRPWPMQFIQTYIDRKYGKESINYMYEDLEKQLEKKYGKEVVGDEKRKLEEDLWPFMDVTYGIAVYQEQLMRLVQAMAWFSLAEADMLRRWVGKKKKDVIKKIKKEFIEKAASYRGYKPETSDYIYEKMITPAADYSFNKSHAACYAFIAYQTAYLKAYYQTEFLTSLMVSDEENMERISLEVDEAKTKNIEILPPSVQESRKHFTYIDDKAIRFGLKAIKWLGDGPIDKIIAVRRSLPEKRFTTLEEFISLTGKEVINKKSLEALIRSGSLDELWERWELLKNIDEMIRFVRAWEKQKETSQIGLFDESEEYSEKLVLEKSEEMNYEDKIFWEKEVLGFMVSGHPFDGMKRYIQKRAKNDKMLHYSFEELFLMKEKNKNQEEKFLKSLRQYATLLWVVVWVRKTITKTGKNMLFLYCESFDFDFEAVVYDKDYQKYADEVAERKVVLIEWMLNIDLQYERKSIQVKEMRVLTLSQVRNQALDLNLCDNSKRILQKKEEEKDEKIIDNIDKNCDNTCVPLCEEIKTEEMLFIVDIPLSTSKKELLDLKEFLFSEKDGHIQVYINFKGQQIDTKKSISSLHNIKKWIIDTWGESNF